MKTKEQIIVDALGETVDRLHTTARATQRWYPNKPEKAKAYRDAADWISEQRKELQHG